MESAGRSTGEVAAPASYLEGIMDISQARKMHHGCYVARSVDAIQAAAAASVPLYVKFRHKFLRCVVESVGRSRVTVRKVGYSTLRDMHYSDVWIEAGR